MKAATDTTGGFAREVSFCGTYAPAQAGHAPTRANSAAGAGKSRRALRSISIPPAHPQTPVPRQAAPAAAPAPDPVPTALTRMPITSAHSWANTSDVPLSAGAAGPSARSPSMARPGRRINAGSPPPPRPARPAPPSSLPRPAPARPGTPRDGPAAAAPQTFDPATQRLAPSFPARPAHVAAPGRQQSAPAPPRRLRAPQKSRAEVGTRVVSGLALAAVLVTPSPEGREFQQPSQHRFLNTGERLWEEVSAAHVARRQRKGHPVNSGLEFGYRDRNILTVTNRS